MFRATGEGKAEIDAEFSSPGIIRASLYNFDFDDMGVATLKPEHERFLDDKVVPLLGEDRGRIWLVGSASRVGKADYNQRLSQDRVDRVVVHLLARGIRGSQMQPRAVGNTLTVGHAIDDEQDRAVTLTIFPKRGNEPPPPVIIPPKPAVSRSFKIAMVLGLSPSKTWAITRLIRVTPKLARFAGPLTKLLKGKVAAGAAVDFLFFDIWDTTNNLSSFYIYAGVGAGAGLTHFPPLSGTHRGPWNSFVTSAPISSSQFDGFTRFTTAGGGSKSINYLHLEGTPEGVDAVHMTIETGDTVGLGASFTIGDLILLDGPDPFSGP